MGAAVLASVFLTCTGWSATAGAVQHTVQIAGPDTSVDYQPYSVQETPTVYTLTKTNRTVADFVLTGMVVMRIDRVTGAYIIKADDKTTDWSRPADAGCAKVDRKF